MITLKYFKIHEFACKCRGQFCLGNTGLIPYIDIRLIKNIDILRDEFGYPLLVNSCIRCPQWNKKVGGASRSAHIFGQACDLTPTRNNEMVKKNGLASILREIGGLALLRFGGIGLYKTFIHLDVATNIQWLNHRIQRPLFWVHNKKNKLEYYSYYKDAYQAHQKEYS